MMEIYTARSLSLSIARVIDVIATAGLASSRGHARRLIRQRGIKINNVTVEDELAVMVLLDQQMTATQLVAFVNEAKPV